LERREEREERKGAVLGNWPGEGRGGGEIGRWTDAEISS